MRQQPYFSNDEHALMAGLLMGHLMGKGVVCAFSVDADGNYMNEIIINMEPGLDSFRVKVEVLPE